MIISSQKCFCHIENCKCLNNLEVIRIILKGLKPSNEQISSIFLHWIQREWVEVDKVGDEVAGLEVDKVNWNIHHSSHINYFSSKIFTHLMQIWQKWAPMSQSNGQLTKWHRAGCLNSKTAILLRKGTCIDWIKPPYGIFSQSKQGNKREALVS